MAGQQRPLWTCPKCRHRFVTPNMSHSCGRYRIEDHLNGKDPVVRELFDRFRDAVFACGPVTMYAQKTRIVFQARARFIAMVPRAHWLDCGLWLKRRADDPRWRKIEHFPPRDYVHHFRITEAAQLDEGLAQYLREAYRVGCQEL